jgi:predicted secreted hydrolase
MDRLAQFRATLDNYRTHGWQLARVLMTHATLEALRRETATDETRAKIDNEDVELKFENVAVTESELDAMWFRRASSGGREAWELRLAAEPYALFEMFEPDEAEEDREDVRREMEARARMKDEG